MASVGETIEHPVTGERITFLETAASSDGAVLKMAFEMRPRAFIAGARAQWNAVERVDVRHRSSSGGETVVIYDMVTTTPAGTQPIVEWIGVEDGRIAWIRSILDTAPFAFLRSGQ